MRLAVNGHPCPSVGDNLDLGRMDMSVSLDKVGREDRGEELRWSYGMLFCHDVGSLFHGIGGDYNAVIGFGVAILVSLQLNGAC